MTKRSNLLLVLALLLGLAGSLHAQEQKDNNSSGYPTPKDMIEVGVSGGYVFISGDLTQNPGYGAGLHIRKALDYVFSLRVDGFYGIAKGERGSVEAANYRENETTYMAGTGYGVISANALRWNQSTKKVNLYAMIGLGGSYFKAATRSDPKRPLNDPAFSFIPHVAGGVGAGFRLSPRMNIGLEHQVFVAFGSKADLVDGYNTNFGTTDRSLFRDIVNFTAVKINFNIGNPSKQSEPLYWVNPLESVMNDLSQMKQQQALALEDSDNDGVIDAIDQDPNTPPDVPVDTKGRVLDSDRDGVPDYKDREPYFPPRPGERVNEEGVVVNPMGGAGGGVSEERVREIIAEELQNYQLRDQSGAVGAGPMTEWFLPMIHFGVGSERIKYSDYGTLASIARMMKGNPNLRLVVTGYTDNTGPESLNNQLSYDRANAVVEHLVNNHSIGRGRLILQWKGANDLLVPTGSSYMNRRVEFRVGQPADVEMDPPAGGTTEDTNDGY